MEDGYFLATIAAEAEAVGEGEEQKQNITFRIREGKKVKIQFRGALDNTIRDILGGVRSACAYTGAIYLKDFSKTARFVTVNRTHNDQSV